MATQKKTAEVDYSMQEKIMALYELQKIDSKIDEINKVKGELPLEVQDLEDEMTGLRTRIDNINAEIEELNTLTKQRKREVDQAKILIGNYKEQQNNVRNNREFDAITKEIEYQELEIELAEKRLKEYSAGVKAKKLQLEEAEAVADGRAADLAAKKSELEGIEAETAPLVAEFEVQADRAKAKIDERLLAAYSRIRQNGGGDRQARRLRRLLQPHSPAASGGNPSGQEDHYLRVLRTYPRDRSRRGSGVADHSVNKRAGVIQLRPSSFSRAATTRPRRRESPRRRRRTMRTNRLCTGRRS